MHPSPALRLLVRRGRVIRRRPIILGAALMGRMRDDASGYLVWPSEEQPEFAFRPAAVEPAAWVRSTFERHGRGGRFARAHVWHALRSRALLVGEANDVW